MFRRKSQIYNTKKKDAVRIPFQNRVAPPSLDNHNVVTLIFMSRFIHRFEGNRPLDGSKAHCCNV